MRIHAPTLRFASQGKPPLWVTRQPEKINDHMTLTYQTQAHPQGAKVGIGSSEWEAEANAHPWTALPPKTLWPGKIQHPTAKQRQIHAFVIDLRQHPALKGWEKRTYTTWQPIVVEQYQDPILLPTRRMKARMLISAQYRKDVETMQQRALEYLKERAQERVIKRAHQEVWIQGTLRKPHPRKG